MLWVVAILLPCILLVTLAFVTLTQERELAKKRAADHGRLKARDIAEQLVERLESIRYAELNRLDSASYANSATALVAWVSKGRVVLPWQVDPQARRFAAISYAGEFGRKVRLGERAEHVDRNFRKASRHYTAAREAARDPLQTAYADLLVARAAAGERPQTVEERFLPIVHWGAERRDEDGVPFALYAFSRIPDSLRRRDDVQRALENLSLALDSSRWTSPAACYAAVSVAQPITLKRDRCAELERAERSAQDGSWTTAFQHGLKMPGGERTWFADGSPVWLMTIDSRNATDSVLIAVRLESLVSSGALEPPADAEFTALEREDAHSLGPRLAGLWIMLPPVAAGALESARALYSISVVLALSVVLFGSYLLWRDVQREIGLAQLRSQFVAGVTHELKTPLTAIRMFAETLREREHAPHSLRSEYLDTIVSEAERLTRLLNNVLDFSRVEQDQRRYHLEPGDLRESVRAAIRAMKHPIEQNGFALTVEEGVHPIPVCIDADAIEQAILNLITNSLKYSGTGRTLVIRVERGREHATVAVADDGVGIAASEHARIFERFYRVQGPHNDSVSGAGLGLALVEHIVRAHGGYITVDSAPGRGSTFTLWLPLYQNVARAGGLKLADQTATVTTV